MRLFKVLYFILISIPIFVMLNLLLEFTFLIKNNLRNEKAN